MDMPKNLYHKAQSKFLAVLDRFSSILKIDLKYILRGGSLLGSTQLTSAAISFLLTLAFANFLPQDIFGTYKYILATYALLAILSLPGVDTAVIETTARGYHGAFMHSVWTKFRWGFLGTLASFAYAGYHFYNGAPQLGWVFILVGFFMPFMEALSTYASFLNGDKKYEFWAVSEFLNQIISSLAIFITIYFTDNIYTLVTAYFVSYIVVKTGLVIYIKNKYIMNDKLDPTYLDYGKQLTWFQIVTRGVASVDSLVLFHFMGPVQVAVFSIANAIPMRVQSIFKMTGTLAFPKYANVDEKTLARTLPKKMLLFGGLIFIVCLAYVAIIPFFFKFFFPKYLESTSYTQLLIFYNLSAITYPFSSYLAAHRRVKENYWIAITSFIVKVITLVVFVPMYGVWGAVISILASSWSNIIFAFVLLKRAAK
jgi:O-antigen/teichoic acid export membrane protein